MENRQHCFSMLRERPFVILDTETTGLDTTAEAVELAICSSKGAVLLNTLVKPVGPISPVAEKVHGISEAMLADAPTIAEVLPAIYEAAKGHIIVTYNAAFDIRILDQSCAARGVPHLSNYGSEGFFCAMVEYSTWANRFDFMRQQNRYISLLNAIRREGLQPREAHRALGDCWMTLDIICAVQQRIAFESIRN